MTAEIRSGLLGSTNIPTVIQRLCIFSIPPLKKDSSAVLLRRVAEPPVWCKAAAPRHSRLNGSACRLSALACPTTPFCYPNMQSQPTVGSRILELAGRIGARTQETPCASAWCARLNAARAMRSSISRRPSLSEGHRHGSSKPGRFLRAIPAALGTRSLWPVRHLDTITEMPGSKSRTSSREANTALATPISFRRPGQLGRAHPQATFLNSRVTIELRRASSSTSSVSLRVSLMTAATAPAERQSARQRMRSRKTSRIERLAQFVALEAPHLGWRASSASTWQLPSSRDLSRHSLDRIRPLGSHVSENQTLGGAGGPRSMGEGQSGRLAQRRVGRLARCPPTTNAQVGRRGKSDMIRTGPLETTGV